MGRLKLLGEQEGGGTDDHSALSNLDYAQSGHSGFVPSQGEALVDILRLNQNLIRDSGGNDRITLSTASPHITLSGQAKITGEVSIGGVSPASNKLLQVQPAPSPTTAYLRAIMGSPVASVPSGSAAGIIRGLEFTAGAQGGGSGTTVTEISAVYAYPVTIFYTGTVTAMYGLKVPAPNLFAGNPSVSTFYGIDITGAANSKIVNAYGLKVGDITNNTGFCRLLELGPATPYLRLVGGSDPPANKSNLYLKFGSTFYRVVKSGSYMTLEAA